MATTTAGKRLTELAAPFDPKQVKINPSGKHYVSIDGYINRLNDVLGTEWSMSVEASVELLPEGMTTSSGKRLYMAQAKVRLIALGTSRDGVGADTSFDPDKSVKTAQAEALKKACHQYGIALELWQEEVRQAIDQQQALAAGDPEAVKKAIYDRAIEGLQNPTPTAAQVANFFNVREADLKNPEVLKGLL